MNGSLTKEQFKILAQYEPNMRTAKYSQYCRMLKTNELKEIDAIVKEVTGNGGNTNLNCQSCVYELMLNAANLYFPAKEEMEKKKVVAKAKTAPRKGKTKVNTSK